jgi:hypothetical protein
MKWMRLKGGSVTVNSKLAKNLANDTSSDYVRSPYDGVTREFVAEISKVSHPTWAQIGVDQILDPCQKATELMRYNGAKVLPLVRKNHKRKGRKYRTCTVSVEYGKPARE